MDCTGQVPRRVAGAFGCRCGLYKVVVVEFWCWELELTTRSTRCRRRWLGCRHPDSRVAAASAHKHSYPRKSRSKIGGHGPARPAQRVWVAPGAKRHMPNPHTARPHLKSHNLAAHLLQLERNSSLCARKGNNKRLEGPFLSRRFLFAYA